MNKRFKLLVLVISSIILIVTAALAYSGFNRPGASAKEKDRLIKDVENQPDQFLRIVGNDDCPLKIIDARVKELASDTFERLTGAKAKAYRIVSAPEVNLMNVSGKTIIEFTFFIRDPKTKTMRIYTPNARSIQAGEVFKIPREHFGGAERVTLAGKDGKAYQKLVQTDFTSEKKWMNFAPREDLYATIGMVSFEDGSKWIIKEEGDVK